MDSALQMLEQALQKKASVSAVEDALSRKLDIRTYLATACGTNGISDTGDDDFQFAEVSRRRSHGRMAPRTVSATRASFFRQSNSAE